MVAFGDHLAEGVAVDPRQVTVQDHDVVGVDVELGRRLKTVVRGVHRHALVAQALDQDVGERSRVFDDEHPHAGTAVRASGRPMLTRSPPSGRADRSRVPPWASAIAATIDSPRPAPWPDPVRSAPRRRNGWASC